LAIKQKAGVMFEWHWEKNGELDPATLSVSSNKKAWWVCRKTNQLHEWQAVINSRSGDGNGCPMCRQSRMERNMGTILNTLLSGAPCSTTSISSVDRQVKLPDSLQSTDFIVRIRDTTAFVAIEMDGIQHFQPVTFFGGEAKFKKTQVRDQQKDKLLEGIHVHLLRIDFTVSATMYKEHVQTFLQAVAEAPEVWHHTCIGESYATPTETDSVEPPVENTTEV